jgi:hypothetical protein
VLLRMVSSTAHRQCASPAANVIGGLILITLCSGPAIVSACTDTQLGLAYLPSVLSSTPASFARATMRLAASGAGLVCLL